MFDLFIIRVCIVLECLRQRISTFLRSKRGEIELPDYVLSDLARAFLADIIEFFARTEHQAAYEEWRKQRENISHQKAMEKT